MYELSDLSLFQLLVHLTFYLYFKDEKTEVSKAKQSDQDQTTVIFTEPH